MSKGKIEDEFHKLLQTNVLSHKPVQVKVLLIVLIDYFSLPCYISICLAFVVLKLNLFVQFSNSQIKG